MYKRQEKSYYNASQDTNSASLDVNSASNSASSDANRARYRKKRLSKEELKKLIISICADWVSIEEIVERSGKSTSYIRNAVIPLLIAEKATFIYSASSGRMLVRVETS